VHAVTHLALLPSPLLGPAAWSRVAVLLRERGLRVTQVGLPERITSVEDVLTGFVAALPDSEPVVLVPHSNAGLYVAAVAARVRVRGAVYVDAGLPSLTASAPTAPAWLRERLGDLAGPDGILPPWTEWWPEADVAGLFPDPATHRAVEREQPRLPLAYFDAEVPTPAGWEQLPAAYLAFGDAYADERAEAVRRGWPVSTLRGGHLHMLVDPAGVADALTGLLAAWADGAGDPG
jgi:Alpha/beta hydrolase family